jgi:aryl-alcohol dehydrogenase (NADP+)
MQNHYNLLYREEEREMLPLCADEGIGVIPWSPLARGRLTRPWDEATHRSSLDEFGRSLYGGTDGSGAADGDRTVVERLAEVAARRGVPMAQVALAWMLAKPGVTAPIIGATRPQHLQDAAAAVELDLSAEETAALEEPYTPHPVAGFS